MRLQVNNMSINECYGPALLGHLTSKPVHSHKPPLGLLPRSRSKNTAGSVEWQWLCEIYVALENRVCYLPPALKERVLNRKLNLQEIMTITATCCHTNQVALAETLTTNPRWRYDTTRWHGLLLLIDLIYFRSYIIDYSTVYERLSNLTKILRNTNQRRSTSSSRGRSS